MAPTSRSRPRRVTELELDLTLEALKAGDRQAWETFYDDLSGDLHHYVRRIGADDVDDIVSETMLQVVRDISRFDGDQAQLRPWVFGIAHNRVIDAARRSRRRPREVPLEDDVPGFQSVFDVNGDVDLESLRSGLERLTADQREALWLRYALDFSLESSARIMGSTPDAVASMTHRALRRLRSLSTPQ